MAADMEVLFSLAGRIHTLLRRESSRIIDVEWMCVNDQYAREVIRLVDASGSDELKSLGKRIMEVHPSLLKTADKPAPIAQSSDRKYMNTLR